MRNIQRLFVLIVFALALGAQAAQPAKAPSGYRWQPVPDLKTTLLVPNSWKLTRVLEGEYRIAPAKGDDETALTINLTRDFGKDFKAVNYARSVIISRTQRYLTLDTFEYDQPPFRGYGAVFLLKPETDPTVRRLLMIGNRKTNSMYIFTLETPEERWDAVWETLAPVFEHLRLNEKV